MTNISKSNSNASITKSSRENSFTTIKSNANEEFKQAKQLENALKVRKSIKDAKEQGLNKETKASSVSNLSIKNDISMINSPYSNNSNKLLETTSSNTSSVSKRKQPKVNSIDVRNRVKESMKKYVNRVTKNNDKVKNIVKFRNEKNMGSFTDTVSTAQGGSIIDRAKA